VFSSSKLLARFSDRWANKYRNKSADMPVNCKPDSPMSRIYRSDNYNALTVYNFSTRRRNAYFMLTQIPYKGSRYILNNNNFDGRSLDRSLARFWDILSPRDKPDNRVNQIFEKTVQHLVKKTITKQTTRSCIYCKLRPYFGKTPILIFH